MPMLLVLLFVIIFQKRDASGASKGLLFIFQPFFFGVHAFFCQRGTGTGVLFPESLYGYHDHLRKLSGVERKIFQKLYDRRWSGHRDCGSRGYRDLSGSICLRSGAGTGTGTDFRHTADGICEYCGGNFLCNPVFALVFRSRCSAIALLEVCASLRLIRWAGNASMRRL